MIQLDVIPPRGHYSPGNFELPMVEVIRICRVIHATHAFFGCCRWMFGECICGSFGQPQLQLGPYGSFPKTELLCTPQSVVLVIQIWLESIWFQFSMFQSPNTNVLWNQGRTDSSIQPGSPAVLSSCTHPGSPVNQVSICLFLVVPLEVASGEARGPGVRGLAMAEWNWRAHPKPLPRDWYCYQQTNDSTPLIIVMAPKMNGPEMSPQITTKIYDGE